MLGELVGKEIGESERREALWRAMEERVGRAGGEGDWGDEGERDYGEREGRGSEETGLGEHLGERWGYLGLYR